MTRNRVELKDFTGLRSIYLNFIVFYKTMASNVGIKANILF